MLIFQSIDEWRAFRKNLPSNETLGFVATMGNLHIGHKALLEKAVAENHKTVLSIFVNPTQFNNPEDLKNYPRTWEQDCKLAEEIGIDFVLALTYDDLYRDNYRYKISESMWSLILEGKQRPGHFEGVLTVVMKLLMLVKADHAYFGEKDYQQLQLIRGLVEAFFLDTKIVACETVRNENGLPHSSRNNRLSVEEFKQAQHFPQIFHAKNSCQNIHKELTEAGFEVEYVDEFADRRFAAIRVNKVRLIDNVCKKD